MRPPQRLVLRPTPWSTETLLYVCSRSIDPKMRQVAVMCYLDSYAHREMGEALGWSRQTVHNKLKEIRSIAAQLMGDNQ